jgi:hypothetical protein
MSLKKTAVAFSIALLVALIAEFVLLEGTLGVSLPQDRSSAISKVEIKEKGIGLHYITQNRRFTVVDLLTDHGSGRETFVLRETFYMDRQDSAEGPPEATVTVEGLNGKNVRWAFHEPGERGDVITPDLYMVTSYGGGEIGNTYTYFSLLDGKKVHTNRYSELSRDELEALDRAILK